jgi:hypothetical protein
MKKQYFKLKSCKDTGFYRITDDIRMKSQVTYTNPKHCKVFVYTTRATLNIGKVRSFCPLHSLHGSGVWFGNRELQVDIMHACKCIQWNPCNVRDLPILRRQLQGFFDKFNSPFEDGGKGTITPTHIHIRKVCVEPARWTETYGFILLCNHQSLRYHVHERDVQIKCDVQQFGAYWGVHVGRDRIHFLCFCACFGTSTLKMELAPSFETTQHYTELQPRKPWMLWQFRRKYVKYSLEEGLSGSRPGSVVFLS